MLKAAASIYEGHQGSIYNEAIHSLIFVVIRFYYIFGSGGQLEFVFYSCNLEYTNLLFRLRLNVDGVNPATLWRVAETARQDGCPRLLSLGSGETSPFQNGNRPRTNVQADTN